MREQSLYVLSNSSMNVFPSNTRTEFSNKFSKEIQVTTQDRNENLWISIENVNIQNTIIPYKSIDGMPDIICHSSKLKFELTIPENYFETVKSFDDFLRHEIRRKTLEALSLYNFNGNTVIHPLPPSDLILATTPPEVPISNNSQLKQIDPLVIPMISIYLKGFKFNIKTSKDVYTLISPRFYKYLGFSVINDVKIEEWYNNKKYLVIGKYGTENHLTANKVFDLNLYKPGLLKLVCENITPNLSPGESKYVVESIPITYMKKCFNFTPQNFKLYKINTNTLRYISIKLLDETDQLVHFAPGVPTIVKLRILEMNNKNNNFYIQVSNSDSLDIFTKNTCSSFSCKLPKEVYLDNSWKVSLTNIYIPPSIHNIYNPINIISIEEFSSVDPTSVIKTYQTSIITGYYHTSSDLLKSLNNCLKDTPIKFDLHRRNKRFYILAKSGKGDIFFKLKLHKKLLGIIGTLDKILVQTNDDYVTLPFYFRKTYGDYDLMYNKEFIKEYSLTEKRITCCFTADPKLTFSISPFIFIYLNIVRPSNVGHSSVPLLKIIPVNITNPENGYFIEFDTLEYFPLNVHNFQIIHFEIRSHDGDLLSVGDGRVLATLSFSPHMNTLS